MGKETSATASTRNWPDLPFEEWKDTCATLHLWTQVIGKIRLIQTPWINHSWHTTLYVTSKGLTTTPIPYGSRMFEFDFDFLSHQLCLNANDGGSRTIQLAPMSVSDFYKEVFAKLQELGFEIKIHTMPNEIADAIPLDQG